jgi:hypothetical protein
VACDEDAPAVVIQALLKAYPEASILTGTSNMNPLHITCSSQHASVHVVRVLLEVGRAGQFEQRDVDGDTPLATACRCGAPVEVLEVLLRANPSVVHQRDYEGLTPLIRLWVRYFVILGDDIIDSVNCAADLTGELLEAWNKTELLLRCAHHGALLDVHQASPAPPVGPHHHFHRVNQNPLQQNRREEEMKVPPDGEQRQASSCRSSESENGANNVVERAVICPSSPFRAVHAAAAVDCPRPIVRIAATVYPAQLQDRDELGRTPLLIAAAAPIFKVRDLSDEGYTLEDVIHGDQESNDGMTDLSEQPSQDNLSTTPSVIEVLLNTNQEDASRGAAVPDPAGRLPLHLALQTGKRWTEGVQHLLEVHPDSVGIRDPDSSFYPFMLAACNCPDLGSTYGLLRSNPNLLESVRNGDRKNL